MGTLHMNIEARTQIPGLSEANYLNAKLKQGGIKDVEFRYDRGILPRGMWAVCQVRDEPSILLLPGTQVDRRPLIMWWCKDHEGRFRLPNDQDLEDILKTIKRAHKIWDKGGDWLADRLDEQDEKRHTVAKARRSERIRHTARDMDLYRKLKRSRNL